MAKSHDPDHDDNANAPPVTQFEAVWNHLRKNRFMDMLNVGVLRNKSRKIQFCLAEALRKKQRKLLRAATCIAISQDATGTRHLIRFCSVAQGLERHRGILGMVRDSGTGHKAIMHATDSVFRAAATSLAGAPPRNGNNDTTRCCTCKPHLDSELYMHIRLHSRIWNSDAASDERLAARESRTWQPKADDVRPLLPNLQLINKDKAHACRRTVCWWWWRW